MRLNRTQIHLIYVARAMISTWSLQSNASASSRRLLPDHYLMSAPLHLHLQSAAYWDEQDMGVRWMLIRSEP